MAAQRSRDNQGARAERMAKTPRGGLSIRVRELVVLTVLTLAVVALTTAIQLYLSHRLLWNATLREADLVARQIYSQSAHALSRGTPAAEPWTALQSDQDLRALLNASVGYAPWLLYALIADPTDTARIHSDAGREGREVPRQPGLRELIARHALPPLWRPYETPQIYEVSLPFDLDGKPFATIRLGIALPLVRAQLEDSLRYTVALGVFALIAALAVGIALSSVTLRPIRALAEDMARLRRGEFDVGHGARPGDEFGKLAYQLQLLGRQMQSDRTRLTAERSRLETAVDQLEDGIMFLTAEGRVLFANRAVEVAFGTPAKALVGAPVDEMVGPDHPLRPLVAKALQQGASSRNVTLEIPTDGRPVELLASVFSMTGQGGAPEGAILVVRDPHSLAVSARTFQSLIQYSAQLAALGQVTSEVTHDVKNPLHAMTVHVAFLRERLAGQPADVQRSLDILEAEIRRADSVVSRFMQAVRPEDISMKPLDLNALLQGVSTVLAADWKRQGVALMMRPDPRLPPVPGDEEMLRRAFMNIVLNACQALPMGGDITIRTEREDALAKVTVADTGVGIAPEDLERIFAAYYTTKPGGTGLGLPLVRRAVDLHHGDIQFLSTVGRGTTVVVRLPLEAER
jgi:PAS domain S-box-containing protein